MLEMKKARSDPGLMRLLVRHIALHIALHIAPIPLHQLQPKPLAKPLGTRQRQPAFTGEEAMQARLRDPGESGYLCDVGAAGADGGGNGGGERTNSFARNPPHESRTYRPGHREEDRIAWLASP